LYRNPNANKGIYSSKKLSAISVATHGHSAIKMVLSFPQFILDVFSELNHENKYVKFGKVSGLPSWMDNVMVLVLPPPGTEWPESTGSFNGSSNSQQMDVSYSVFDGRNKEKSLR
jgi:hypothetical protein